jgi:small subunit ribosomal protein S17
MSEVQTTETRGRRKTRQGKVVSDKMDKTVVVSVESRVRHPLYGRIVRRSKRFKAHDENNDFHVGDTVEITECRPLSKDKCWRVSRLIERAK